MGYYSNEEDVVEDSTLQRYREDDAFVGACCGLLVGPLVGALVGAVVGLIATGSAGPAAGLGAMPVGFFAGPMVLGTLGAISNHRKAKAEPTRGGMPNPQAEGEES